MSANLRSVEDIYQIAPESALKRLLGFRERVPAQTHEIGKNLYPIWDMGRGERAAVFIPSGMGHGEVWFPYMVELSAQIRCVAISLAVQKTMEDYCRDIHELLARLGIKRAVLIAHAIGGLIAQMYVRMYPGEVESLVLCMSGAPAKGLSKEATLKWTERRKLVPSLTFSPFNTMKSNMAYKTFYSMCPPETEDSLLFWRAYITETYEHYVYKKQYINLNCRAIPDIYEKLPFEKGDLAAWPGKVLLFEAENDQYYPEEEKQLLKELYPNARVESIGNAGQLAMLAEERKAAQIMREFIVPPKELAEEGVYRAK